MAREKSMMEKWRDWRLDESVPDYFRGYYSNIENNLKRLDKNVKQFIVDLGKDNLKNESLELAKLYKQHVIKFKIKFEEFKQKTKLPIESVNEEVDETALPMVQVLNTLSADIRRADYNKELEWGAKNPKKVKEIIKAVNMISKIVSKLK